ncbi:unnamed protein product, partial [Mesorhabditis spiculigera]
MATSRVGATLPKIKVTVGHIPQRLKDTVFPPGRARLEILRQIVTRLVREERVELKYNRAVEARQYTERLIQLAVNDGQRDEYTNRMMDWWLLEKDLVEKMYKVIVPRFKEAEGPYTSLFRLPDQLLTQRLRGGRPHWKHYQIGVLEIDGNPFPPIKQNDVARSDPFVETLIEKALRTRSADLEAKLKSILLVLRALLWFAHAIENSKMIFMMIHLGAIADDEKMGKGHPCLQPLSPPSTPATVNTGNNDFLPDPSCFTEARTRINVGWLSGPADAKPLYDTSISTYSQRLGCKLYNFVCYPVGGAVRGFWEPKSNDYNPPPISLPDLQLQNHLWETYVNGQVSAWIDCDADDEKLAALSEKEILKEINYACYLGLRNFTIPLKRASSPRLAAVLRKWMWTKNTSLSFWIFVPTSSDNIIINSGDPTDIWTIWSDFRTLCNNFHMKKLNVGLRLCTDVEEEFLDGARVSRWRGEPLAAFWVDSEVFLNMPETGAVGLSHAHSTLLSALWVKDQSRVVVRGPDDRELPSETLTQMATALRAVVSNCAYQIRGFTDVGYLADGSIDYTDVLQMPLQPLSDNLDSGVYNTFEQDPCKYTRYRDAIFLAIKDIAEVPSFGDDLTLYVLGAGRGPLVSASIEAFREFNKKHRTRHNLLRPNIVVVEKNPNAIVTLRFCNERAWQGSCTIVESDMRSLEEKVEQLELEKPDIIVSELLGSFGDNELSPECLDGVSGILKPKTISIPQSYTNYITPIHSTYMYQSVINGSRCHWSQGMGNHGRQLPVEQEDGSWIYESKTDTASIMDQVYVVFLKSATLIANPMPVFTFDHPNFTGASNERSQRIPFEVGMNVDIMGFAGYFRMTLYKDVELSIEPSSHSPGLISWFPALLPLRKMHRVNSGDKITLIIDRKVDSTGVWYEWQLEYEENGETKLTPRQNKNGETYYMRLSS